MASTLDLSAVADAADFVQALRLLKIWAGNPSFDQLARRSGVPRSTLADGAANTPEAHRWWAEAVRIYKDLGVPVSEDLAQKLDDVERSVNVVDG